VCGGDHQPQDERNLVQREGVDDEARDRHDGLIGRIAPEGDLVEQASVIHDKMAATLVAAKRGLRDIVRVVRYVTPKAFADVPALDAFQRQSLAEVVSISTVPVRSLLRQEALIEIEAIAEDGGADGLDYLAAIVAPDRMAITAVLRW